MPLVSDYYSPRGNHLSGFRRQVFILTRNYAGYAQNDPTDQTSVQGCVSPEPFAYEQAFGIQRLIVAQIKQNAGINGNDQYAGQVKFTGNSDDTAPWFDWGPYLWASGNVPRLSDQLVWCNGQGDPFCAGHLDFRNGDSSQGLYGDLTHPGHDGQTKAATKIFQWLTGPNNLLVTPWINQ